MFKKLVSFCSKITKLEEQFIRFLFVGVLNTIFGYVVYAFFVFIGFGYVLAPLFSTIVAILFNFKTTGTIVFNNRNNKLLFKFFLVYTIVYITNVVFLKIFILLGFENLYLSGLILVIPMALLSYYLNKNLVFKNKSK